MTKLAIPIKRLVKYDGSDSNVQYIGEASFGIATSAPFWRISRLTFIGNSFTLDWADGNAEFDNIWDDRTSLTYGT